MNLRSKLRDRRGRDLLVVILGRGGCLLAESDWESFLDILYFLLIIEISIVKTHLKRFISDDISSLINRFSNYFCIKKYRIQLFIVFSLIKKCY